MATKADIDQWIAAQGGTDAVVHSFEDVELPDPRGMRTLPDGSENEDYDRAFKDKKISTRRETWTNKASKATFSATRSPFKNDEFEDIKQGAATATATAANPAASNPSSRYEVRQDGPGGAPRYLRIEQRQGANGQTVETAEEVPQSQWPVQGTSEVVRNGRRIKVTTYANGLGTKEDDAGEDTTNRGTTVLKPDGKGGTIAVTTYPDSRAPTTVAVPGVPSDKPQPHTITLNGQVYERDDQTGTYAPAKGLPTEGEASVSSVEMPQIIAGHIQDALIEYHTRLWADPRLTNEQRISRFNEFKDIATATQNQANEQQRERESQRNADYNTANSKLTYLENSTQAALTFTQGLIGKAKPGSGAVGEIFAALMGISALKMQLSGINDLKSTVTSSQLALNNPAKLAEQTQQIASQVAVAAAPTPTATATTGAPSSQSVSGGSPTSASAPQPTAPATPTSAAPTSTTLPAGRPDQTQAAPQIESAINPPQGTATPQPTNPEPSDGQPVGGRVLPQPAAPSADTGQQYGPPEDYVRVENLTTGETGIVPRSEWRGRGNGYPGWQEVPGSSVRPADSGDPVQVPATTDPTVSDPNYQQPQYAPPIYETKPADVPPGEITQTQQQSEWAALAALQQQQQAEATAQPQAQPQAQQQQTSYSDSPALLHAEAASRAPWQMSDADYQRYKAAGISDDVIFKIPGRAAA